MEAAVIDKIVALSPASIHSINGASYSDRTVKLIEVPHIPAFAVCSLTALVGLIDAGAENFDPALYLLHVLNEKQVELRGRATLADGHRSTIAVAKPVPLGLEFRFGNFYPQEDFVIALQSLFVPSDDLAEVLKLASTLDTSQTLKQEDDGVTQRATVKSGVVLTSEVVVKRRVTLAPYRTFQELIQPASEFIFRIRSGGIGAGCALFEADGGCWKLQAIASICEWLRNSLHGSNVEGCSELPIIA